MTAKIEWYEELLASDPGSKVFFPLARCLVDGGKKERAVEVLRNGLLLNPEFLEARFFLIEILVGQGAFDAVQADAHQVMLALKAYPGIWKALERTEARGNSDDVLIWRLFVALLSGRHLSLADILLRGLTPFEEENTSTAPASTPAPSAVAPAPPTGTPGISEIPDGEAVISSDEDVNLRTRSMADILAEQGDLDGAVHIYEELLSGDPESVSLRRRIAELRRQKSEGMDKNRSLPEKEEEAVEAPSVSRPEIFNTEAVFKKTRQDPGVETVSGTGVPPVDGLENILESLAERLEARAQA